MKSFLLCIVAMILSVASFAQDKPNTTEVTVKDTPASQALVQFAKDQTSDQAVLNTKLQQARFNLDASNKTLNDQLSAAQKDLDEKLKADKKYKPLIDSIEFVKKQLSENGTKAQADFAKDASAIQQKVAIETNEVQTLIPVVRKENGLPDAAQFSIDTQKWTKTSASVDPPKK